MDPLTEPCCPNVDEPAFVCVEGIADGDGAPADVPLAVDPLDEFTLPAFDPEEEFALPELFDTVDEFAFPDLLDEFEFVLPGFDLEFELAGELELSRADEFLFPLATV